MAGSRKIKSDDERRSVHMLIALTPGERRLLEERCGEMYPGVFMRQMAFAAIRQQIEETAPAGA